MKTAISIPDELFDAADREAERLGISRSQLFQKALAAYLRQHDEDTITESLNRVYSDEDPGRLDPVLDQMQRASIAKESW